MHFNRLFIQRRFADLLQYRLEHCSVISTHPYKSNFRCGICGDSSTKKHKRRGFLVENTSGIRYYCHNCGYSRMIDSYMKDYQPDLYQQYIFELVTEKGGKYTVPVESLPQEIQNVDYLQSIRNITELAFDHPAVQYLLARQIPKKHLDRLFYVGKFFSFINHWIPGKFKDYVVENYEHGRILLPLRHADGSVFGVIGRSLNPDDAQRYITIKFQPDVPKIFGLEKLDLRKHAYVVEGPMDSFFLDNSIALAGTDGSIDGVFTSKKQFTIVLDNQPRNAELISKYNKYISNGSSIVIWPHQIQSKDINQMVLDGVSIAQIENIVQTNTFSGIQATISLAKWKKV